MVYALRISGFLDFIHRLVFWCVLLCFLEYQTTEKVQKPSNPEFYDLRLIVRDTPHTLPWPGLIGMGESLRGGVCTVPMNEMIKV
jgi:hypothetical protein